MLYLIATLGIVIDVYVWNEAAQALFMDQVSPALVVREK